MKKRMLNILKTISVLMLLCILIAGLPKTTFAQYKSSRSAMQDTEPTPLPLTCTGLPTPTVCTYGYVYYDGIPVSGANLHIDSAYGDLDTSTASGSASSDPYYYVNLNAPPLLVSAGDIITITATYNAHTTSMSYQVGPGGQQIDVVIVINPVPIFGDGSDGDLVVGAGQTIYMDNVRSALAAYANIGQRNLTIDNASSFLVGQEVLVIQIQGNEAGSYEFGEIAMIIGNTITLQYNLINSYEIGGNSKTQVLRVPHYRDVIVQSGGVLTAHSWDGNTGGIVVFRVSGTVTVNGTISASGLNGVNGGYATAAGGAGIGFRGGTGISSNGAPAYQGEGTAGTGTTSTAANGNGGGGGDAATDDNSGGAGGGGGNTTAGSAGTAGNNGVAGSGGSSAGTADLATMFFGGGGGGGSRSGTTVIGGGGGGGGIIFIAGTTINMNDLTGYIISNGGNGGTCGTVWGYGGGGAGGSILLKAQVATLGTNRITASGGTGGGGGAGSIGRIRLEYGVSLIGTTDPPASIIQIDFSISPIITINNIYPNPAEQDDDTIFFRGSAVDNDEYGSSITQYLWRSDLDGILSTQASFTMPATNLSVGTHTIYFKAKDDEGEWSEEISRTLVIETGTRYVFLPNITEKYIVYFQGTMEVEPNNSWDQANGPLRSAIDYHGYPNDQKDYFSIYVYDSGSVIVDLTNHTGIDTQLQLFYNTIDNRVAYDPSPPYHIDYPGQPGWYYIYIYTGSGFNEATLYTLNVDYP